MSMPRDPVFHVGEPAHNLIPAAGGAVWYPLHASSLLVSGIAGIPALALTGTPAADPYTTAGVYTFPTNNTDAVLKAEDNAVNLYLSSQLSLYGSAVDSHVIVAMDLSFSAAPTGTATIWGWGRNLSASTLIGMDLTSGESPRFIYRAKGSSAIANPAFTVSSGTFASFRNQGVFSMVVGIRVVSATNITIELQLGNGTLSALYTLASTDVTDAGGGSVLPGISDGVTMADFGGLYLGARMTSALSNFWINGAANVGAIGNFSARKFATYSASRVTDTLAYMLARKLDFPRNLSSDYS